LKILHQKKSNFNEILKLLSCHSNNFIKRF
jgi:hypothetical protein